MKIGIALIGIMFLVGCSTTVTVKRQSEEAECPLGYTKFVSELQPGGFSCVPESSFQSF